MAQRVLQCRLRALGRPADLSARPRRGAIFRLSPRLRRRPPAATARVDKGGLHAVGRAARAGQAACPDKLDNIVAGGIGNGHGIAATLLKEADEEAAIPADLARRAVPVGAVSYLMENDSRHPRRRSFRLRSRTAGPGIRAAKTARRRGRRFPVSMPCEQASSNAVRSDRRFQVQRQSGNPRFCVAARADRGRRPRTTSAIASGASPPARVDKCRHCERSGNVSCRDQVP